VRWNDFNGWLNQQLTATGKYYALPLAVVGISLGLAGVGFFGIANGVFSQGVFSQQANASQGHNPVANKQVAANQLVVKKNHSAKKVISTVTPLNAPVTFAVLGDVGSRLPGQYQVAKALVQVYQQQPFQFAMLLGDNIYPNGDVKRYGEASFTQPYAPLLKAGVPFYVCLGNHDVLFGFKQDQIDFYKMPSAYYAMRKGPVELFAIDTNDFNALQQKWLNAALRKSTAPWKIVFGHHPIYSNGQHGKDTILEKSLAPVLVANKVNLYLAGHEHNYERFTPINGVTHVVAGGGGAALRPFVTTAGGDVQDKRSLVRASVHHFMVFKASASQLSASVLKTDLSTLDSFTLTNAEATQPLKAALVK
jgi:hypothetical protein